MNEDVARIEPHPENEAVLLGALADGQGGQAGGLAAARTAVETCLAHGIQQKVNRLLHENYWMKIIGAADAAVSENDDAGFTTLICFCVGNGEIYGASSGDSAALLVSNDQYKVLTEDQRKNPPVGTSAAFPVGFKANLKLGDKLLVMSDGVWRYISMETIAEIARTHVPEELVQVLRELQTEQNRGNLPDDFTIIVISTTP